MKIEKENMSAIYNFLLFLLMLLFVRSKQQQQSIDESEERRNASHIFIEWRYCNRGFRKGITTPTASYEVRESGSGRLRFTVIYKINI